jgi:hypothetical protein
MPKSRQRKPQEKKQPLPPIQAQSRRHWTLFQKGCAAMVAAIGAGAAIVTLLPRVTVDIGEPIDSSNAYTAPITISNTNVIPLERVSLALGICELKIAPQITIKGTNNENCSYGNNARIQPDIWKNHHLGIDDKWRVLMQDAASNGRNTNMIFSGGDITFVVSFVCWPWAWLHIDRVFGREKEFRFKAVSEPDGKFRWFPKTIDNP